MLKSRILTIDEKNLIEDIERVRAHGRVVVELQCNLLTAYIWASAYEINPLRTIALGKPVGEFEGIPIRINEALDTGMVRIR